MKLGEWLYLNGKTQEWLGEETRLSQSYVSRLINGERSPPIETCARIFEATGGDVTANDFMGAVITQAQRRLAVV